MSVLFVDSFDHYTDTAQKWDSVGGAPVISGTHARTGEGGLRLSGTTEAVAKTVDANSGVVVGQAVYLEAAPTFSTTAPQWEFRSGGTVQASGYIDSDRKLRVYSDTGSTLIGTSTTALTLNQWHYVELYANIGGAGTGSMVVRLDETQEISGTGNTDPAGTGNADSVTLSGTNTAYRVDDLYILSTTGSSNTGALGPCAVEMDLPDNSGSNTEWTASAGSNYTVVDDTAPNEDTDYIYTDGALVADSYGFPNLTGTGQIYAVQLMSRNRSDSGTQTVYEVVATGTVLYTGFTGTTVANGTGTAYEYSRTVFDRNPAEEQQWTSGTIDALEFGVSTSYGVAALQPLMWLDASAEGTLFQDVASTIPVAANNDQVARWNDRSGNGNHFTQGTDARRPDYLTNQKNGLPGIRFNQNNLDAMACAINTVWNFGSGTMEMFMVLSQNQAPFGATYVFSDRKSGGANTGFEMFYTGQATKKWSVRWVDGGATDTLTTTTTIGNFLGTKYYLNAYRDGSDRILRLNGAQQASGTDNGRVLDDASADPRIARQNGGTDYNAQTICEWIIFSRSLTATERGQMDNYINSKWGF